jgi:hypothetical protein
MTLKQQVWVPFRTLWRIAENELRLTSGLRGDAYSPRIKRTKTHFVSDTSGRSRRFTPLRLKLNQDGL